MDPLVSHRKTMEDFSTTSRCSIYHNPTAKFYKAPNTKDNSAEIKAFYSSLTNYAPTKLVPLPDLAAELGIKDVYVKAETSRLGLPSFKLLGASWAIRQAIVHHANLPSTASLDDLSTAVKQRGIKLCAATDGNHGRAVAFMGRMLGVKETKVFVPKGLDERIIASIAGEGADVIVADGDYDETVRTAHRWGEEMTGFMLIEAVAYEGYEDIPQWAVEGYTTMLHEIDAQLRVHSQTPSMIIAPLGVGSLTQAIISHYKSPANTSSPPVIATIEPDTAATLHKSLKAGHSLSITTSPTIMAGLECGTVSSIAWPLLKEGVDFSATITDWECHEAILYLKKYGIGAGPCGAAALAGLKRIAADKLLKEKSILGKDDIVVCICTEGTRPYDLPTPIASPDLPLMTALTVIHISSASLPLPHTLSLIRNYAAQWLEYRDIEVQWIDPGTPNASLVAEIPAPGATNPSSITTRGSREEEKTKSLLLLTNLSPTNTRDPMTMNSSLSACLLAFSQLKTSSSSPRSRSKFHSNLKLAIIPSQSVLPSILTSTSTSAILVDASAAGLVTNSHDAQSEFIKGVKRSVENVVGSKITLNAFGKEGMDNNVGEIPRVCNEKGIPVCVVGMLDGDEDEDGNGGQEEGSEVLMAKALVRLARDWSV